MIESTISGPACPFCAEFQSEGYWQATFPQSGLLRRIVAKNDKFACIPSVSPIAPGHVMVVPLEHRKSLASLGTKLSEFEDFLGAMRRKVDEVFGQTLLFEHGVGESHSGGCGVTHAHTHIVPGGDETFRKFVDRVSRTVQLSSHRTLSEAYRQPTKADSYLLIGNDRASYVAVVEGSASQFLRRELAVTLRSENWNWDWRALSGWSEVRETYEALAGREPQPLLT